MKQGFFSQTKCSIKIHRCIHTRDLKFKTLEPVLLLLLFFFFISLLLVIYRCSSLRQMRYRNMSKKTIKKGIANINCSFRPCWWCSSESRWRISCLQRSWCWRLPAAERWKDAAGPKTGPTHTANASWVREVRLSKKTFPGFGCCCLFVVFFWNIQNLDCMTLGQLACNRLQGVHAVELAVVLFVTGAWKPYCGSERRTEHLHPWTHDNTRTVSGRLSHYKSAALRLNSAICTVRTYVAPLCKTLLQ